MVLAVNSYGTSSFEKKWQDCKIESDCLALKGICGPVCINKNYQKEFGKYFAETAPFADCPKSPPIYDLKDVKKSCVKQSCKCQ